MLKDIKYYIYGYTLAALVEAVYRIAGKTHRQLNEKQRNLHCRSNYSNAGASRLC